MITAVAEDLPVPPSRWGPKARFASIVVAVVLGQLGPVAQPYQVGALAADGVRGAEFAGLAVSLEMALYALTLIGVARFVTRLRLRDLALVGMGLSIAGFLGAWGLREPILLVMAAGVGGIGGGLTFAAALAAAAETHEPEKTVGMAAMIALLAYGLFMLVTPVIQQRFGPIAVFGEIALTMLMISPGLLALPATAAVGAGAAAFSLRSVPVICFLAMLSLFGIATGGIYAFMERIGHAIGVPPVTNGVILMMGILAGALGSGIAGKLGFRLGRAPPLYLSLIATGVACFAMAGTSGMWIFAAATVVFQIFYSMSFPYFIGTATFLEPGGGLASMAGGVIFLASSVGAAAAGTVARHLGYGALGVGALAACLLASAVIPRILRPDRPPAITDPMAKGITS